MARVTIHDVARAAGVAASTVSRAFSHPDRLSDATRERVLELAGSLGYRPHPIAQALPRGRTSTLALLVPDVTNPFFFGLIRGAQRRAAAAGYTLVLVDTSESAATEGTHLEHLAGAVDGFVLASSRLPDARLRAVVADHPVVAVNRTVAGAPSVVLDNAHGMRQAAEHLASLGHERLAYLSGPASSWSDRSRWNALRAVVPKLGMDVVRLGPFPPTVDGGAVAADATLGADRTAVLAFNDLMAIGAMRRLRDRGCTVPDRLSVVGCDDIFGADLCDPPLTTLAADIEEAGRTAVDLLLAGGVAEAARQERVVLPVQLRIRGSTAPVVATARRPARHARR